MTRWLRLAGAAAIALAVLVGLASDATAAVAAASDAARVTVAGTNADQPEAAAATQSESAAANVCLAIDDSGSMWTDSDQGPASDPGPNPLRLSAARMVISLLGADANDRRDGVGVVLFGSADEPGVDVVLLPVTELSSNAARDSLATRIESSMWSKAYTRIDRAIDSCLVLLDAAPDHGGRSRIILLTDGVPLGADPRFDAEGQLRMLDWTLEELARRRWSIDVILLGSTARSIADDADSFARRIAGATDGNVYVADERVDLLRIYTDIVAQMTGRTLVQGEPIDLDRTSSVPVRVEDDTATMTVTVVKSDARTGVSLAQPDGALVGGDDVSRTSTGLVETLTVHDPAPGLWSVELDGAGQAYVSLVLRAIERPASDTPSPSTGTTDKDGAGVTIPVRELLAAVVMLALAALIWSALRWLRASRFTGVVALADAPGKVVRLADVEREHRVLGLVQRPLPLQTVAAALGLDGDVSGRLLMRRGALAISALDDEAARPVVFGSEYTVEATPPASLVFAATVEDLPRSGLDLRAPTAAAESAHETSIDRMFEPATPSAPADDATAPESRAQAASSVATVALDDDAWGA